MLNNTLIKILLILVLFQCHFTLLANTESTKELPCLSNTTSSDAEVKKASPIKRVEPKYPKSAARNKQEGWVRLSFVVKADGSVDLPVIEDSSGLASFEKSALNAVKSWTFDPATRGGQTIEQCKNNVQLNFKMNKATKGASRKFVREYKRIDQLINEEKLTAANNAINNLSNVPRQNFYEDKFFFSLKAKYYQILGDNREELINLKKIIPQGKDYLSKESYTYSVARAFQLALISNEFSSALYFYKKLKQFNPQYKNMATITTYVEKINTLVDSSENIYVLGHINERSNWNHYLVRNSFAITDINGELSTIDIRCDNHFSTYLVDSEKQWNIPKNWGQCKVFVQGEQDTEFNFIEVANTSA